MSQWLIDISARHYNHRNAQSQEEKCRKKGSIYKLPPHLISDQKKKAYQPKVVSFGPYHYGEPHLMPMEDHKQRALLHFLDRSPVSLDTIFDSIVKVAQELKDSYILLEREWQDNTEKFVQLMIIDGCFMLELLRVAYQPKNYYSHDDPIFSQHGDLHVVPFIRADMLLLENQLPMLLLLRLKGILENVEPDIEDLNKDILRLLDFDIKDNEPKNAVKNVASQSPNQGEGDYPKLGKCLHVLDLYREGLLHIDNKPEYATPQSPNQGEENNKEDGHNVVRPAIELLEAGISIKKSKSKSLRDITFNGNILKLPNFIVDHSTESMFLNLIAFERCHIPAGSDITSFVAFMDCIIDDGRDIKLLSSKGIITNYIGTDKEAADLFNTMSKDLVMEMTGNLNLVYKDLIKYSNRTWPKWRANLIHTYCISPWVIISVIGAFILFSLTVVQTIFAIPN
ncbi:UPF0481 protein At3g47200-like [Diospyros lotus]|uniref:UPF0481 protein At3g47200-like n=1 Tax=Diospyros lotus TaxID=55363 RepID=UPI002259A939|nr:UPF0481 protein At3g47200-like [Diospyros lotus]XP_052170180.1 UPF0481 protein At3g47200-like [Diospyros lotus]